MLVLSALSETIVAFESFMPFVVAVSEVHAAKNREADKKKVRSVFICEGTVLFIDIIDIVCRWAWV